MKEEILELRRKGYSYKEIVKELGCSPGTVSYHCKKHGLDKPLPQPNKLDKELIYKLRFEYQTKTANEVAEKFNVSKDTVYKYCKGIKNKKIRIQKKVKIICVQCGKKVLASKSTNKYCSGKCKNVFEYEERIRLWKEGKHNGMRGKTSTVKWIKQYIIEKHGEKCMECGWNKRNVYTGKIPIELDHIDGDFTNNKEKNLKLLCPNCHSLTPTYKGANKKKGRPRAKYYRGL